MACAANYAWANRQMIMHLAEEALLHALRISPKELEPAPGLRRGPQHRQAGDPRGRRAPGADLRAPQGRHPGLRPGQAGGAGRLPRRSGSRCSSPATWARRRSCARAPTRPWPRPSAPPATAPAGCMSRSPGAQAGQGPVDRPGTGRRGHRRALAGPARPWAKRCPRPTRTWSSVVGVMDGAGISPKVARLRPLGVVKG